MSTSRAFLGPEGTSLLNRAAAAPAVVLEAQAETFEGLADCLRAVKSISSRPKSLGGGLQATSDWPFSAWLTLNDVLLQLSFFQSWRASFCLLLLSLLEKQEH